MRIRTDRQIKRHAIPLPLSSGAPIKMTFAASTSAINSSESARASRSDEEGFAASILAVAIHSTPVSGIAGEVKSRLAISPSWDRLFQASANAPVSCPVTDLARGLESNSKKIHEIHFLYRAFQLASAATSVLIFSIWLRRPNSRSTPRPERKSKTSSTRTSLRYSATVEISVPLYTPHTRTSRTTPMRTVANKRPARTRRREKRQIARKESTTRGGNHRAECGR